jgi:uncharacterized protein YxjI
MNNKFSDSAYLVTENTGLIRAGNSYNVADSKGVKIGLLHEEIPGFFKKLLKFSPVKTLLGFTIRFYDDEDKLILILQRPFTFFLSKINILSSDGNRLGYFKQKFKLWSGKFDVFDDSDKFIASIKGDWRDWNFKIIDDKKNKIGEINKKWAGLVKEIFTTDDTYLIKVNENLPSDEKILIVASAIVIDMVLKEYS